MGEGGPKLGTARMIFVDFLPSAAKFSFHAQKNALQSKTWI